MEGVASSLRHDLKIARHVGAGIGAIVSRVKGMRDFDPRIICITSA